MTPLNEPGISPEPNSGCWLWTGAVNPHGYGNVGAWIGDRQVTVPVHRLVYQTHKGPIGDGLVLDHKCRTPCCVNPDHLEPVTQAENMRRGSVLAASKALRANQTHCLRGHPLSGANLYVAANGQRRCRQCSASRDRQRRRLFRG